MFRSFDPDDPYGNGASQALGYDAVSRLSSLTVNLAGTASDLTKTFAYNPANQIVTETRSNDAYSQVLANATQTSATNGLNQLSTVNGTSASYDARGNMTGDPATGKTYSYWSTNNQLKTVTSPFISLSYDALDRLWHVEIPAATNYVSDGSDVIAEYDGSNVLQKLYAFDGTGWPLVQYDAAGNRTWMLPDERGSIVALANDSAAMTAINSYDEYGIPGVNNAGTFQYASMLWLDRPGVYAPTFRAYGAHLGRFSQTDPIGMAGGINLYGYVGNDPISWSDPLGLDKALTNGWDARSCTGTRLCAWGTSALVTSIPGAASVARGGGLGGTAGNTGGCGGGSGSNVIVCGFAPVAFNWGGNPFSGNPAVLLPGPFANNPDPNVICGADCTTEVTINRRREGTTPFYFNGTAFVLDPAFRNTAPWLDACLTPICGAVGGAALAYGGPALAGGMATSRTFGVASSRFGNPFFAGVRGTWNRGAVRLGWSYFDRTGMMYFQPRIGAYHVPTILITPPPF